MCSRGDSATHHVPLGVHMFLFLLNIGPPPSSPSPLPKGAFVARIRKAPDASRSSSAPESRSRQRQQMATIAPTGGHRRRCQRCGARTKRRPRLRLPVPPTPPSPRPAASLPRKRAVRSRIALPIWLSIVLCNTPSRAADSRCDKPAILRKRNTSRQRGGSSAKARSSSYRPLSTRSVGISSDKTFNAARSATRLMPPQLVGQQIARHG